ncbi:ionotropic receptor 21a-like [Panulirus ornatus]|uniref:ionotropic receptor 21a-like n=1 Tax=Panulirus ornatus TaxID=150431 RepID=UPI003A8A725E
MERINTWYRRRFTSQLDLFVDKLSDLRGAVVKVSTFMYEPVIFLRRAENGTVVSRYGIDIEVVTAIARVLNITLEFKETPKGETWGEKLENGSWFGLMGQLQRNEVEIGLANLFVSSHWLEVLDLTAPYAHEITCFMTRVEPPLPHWQALAYPFHKWTWLAVLVGLIVSGPLLYLLAWCSSRCGGEIRSLQSLGFSCYYAFGLHFCEAHIDLPRKTSTQIFVTFLWLYTMILTIVYSTNLMSFLLVKKQPAMIETFKDLYESRLEVSSLGVMFRDGLAFASDPYLKSLTKVFKWYGDQTKIFPLLLQGKAVYLGNRKTLEFLLKNKFTRHGIPRVRIMKENYAPYSVAMALQRHSPLKRKLDELMGWIQQSGLVRQFFLNSLRQSASYERDDDGEDLGDDGGQRKLVEAEGVIPLSLDHMQGLFLITCTGWFLCFLSFIFEKTNAFGEKFKSIKAPILQS